MSANQAQFPVQVMARPLGVSRSGFHALEGRSPGTRQQADTVLLEDIKRIHKVSKQTCGAPRIHAEPADEGIHVGRKRVERLMQANGIVGVSRRKFVRTTIKDERVRPALNLVDRNCSIPDDQIDPRCSGLFMARSILREIRDGGKTC